MNARDLEHALRTARTLSDTNVALVRWMMGQCGVHVMQLLINLWQMDHVLDVALQFQEGSAFMSNVMEEIAFPVLEAARAHPVVRIGSMRVCGHLGVIADHDSADDVDAELLLQEVPEGGLSTERSEETSTERRSEAPAEPTHDPSSRRGGTQTAEWRIGTVCGAECESGNGSGGRGMFGTVLYAVDARGDWQPTSFTLQQLRACPHLFAEAARQSEQIHGSCTLSLTECALDATRLQVSEGREGGDLGLAAHDASYKRRHGADPASAAPATCSTARAVNAAVHFVRSRADLALLNFPQFRRTSGSFCRHELLVALPNLAMMAGLAEDGVEDFEGRFPVLFEEILSGLRALLPLETGTVRKCGVTFEHRRAHALLAAMSEAARSTVRCV